MPRNPTYGKHVCTHCREVFDTWKEIQEHKRARNAEDGSHIHCQMCGVGFITLAALDRHFRTVSDFLPFFFILFM